MACPDVIAHITTGEPRTGGWCQVCALPSLVEVTITVTTETAGGIPLGVSESTTSHCINHEVSEEERQ